MSTFHSINLLITFSTKHRKRSFRDELISMLDDAGINYDPKYLD